MTTESWRERLRKAWSVEGWRWFDRVDWTWAARLTLLYLLLKETREWWVRFPVISISIVALLVPGWHRRPWVWFVLTTFLTLHAINNWATADNHVWLLCYWSLALALASSARDPSRSLRTAAASLVGLVFVFATLWKVGLSPDYRSGDFMRVTMVTDGRFDEFLRIFTNVDPDQIVEARSEARRARLQGDEPSTVVLPETDMSIWMAWASSWMIALLEGWVGLSFLAAAWIGRRGPPHGASASGWFTASKDAALLLFAAVTYPFATVVGFGWLLMILGVAQCQPLQRRTKAAYLIAAWLILMARHVPWVEHVAQWF